MHDGKNSQPAQRLSENEEIQWAFRREIDLLFNEAGATANSSTCLIPAPATVTGALDEGFGNDLKKSPQRHWDSLGFKPEHVRVLMSLTSLLEHCARLEATPENLDIALPLFHPGKPTTSLAADEYDKAINALVSSIEPDSQRHLFEPLGGDGRICRICSLLPGGETHIALNVNASGICVPIAEQWWRNLREASHDMNLLMPVYDEICKEKNFSLFHRNVNRDGFPVHEWVFRDCSMLQLPVKDDIPRADLICRGIQCRVMSKSEGLLLWNEAEQYFNQEYREGDRKFFRSRQIKGLDLMPDEEVSDSAERRQDDQLLEAPPHGYNAPPQATTASPSPTTSATRFGTGRYDWAALILIPLVIVLVAGAEDSHSSIAAIFGAVFFALVGFLLFLNKHRWLSLLPFLTAVVFMGIGPDARKPTPTATVSVATNSTPTPKFDPVVPYSPTFSTLKTGTAVTVYNDDGSESSTPWEVNWNTYRPIPRGATQTCPREDFVNEKLVKLDNCQPIPKEATGRAKDIYGVWFYVKLIPPWLEEPPNKEVKKGTLGWWQRKRLN